MRKTPFSEFKRHYTEATRIGAVYTVISSSRESHGGQELVAASAHSLGSTRAC